MVLKVKTRFSISLVVRRKMCIKTTHSLANIYLYANIMIKTANKIKNKKGLQSNSRAQSQSNSIQPIRTLGPRIPWKLVFNFYLFNIFLNSITRKQWHSRSVNKMKISSVVTVSSYDLLS